MDWRTKLRYRYCYLLLLRFWSLAFFNCLINNGFSSVDYKLPITLILGVHFLHLLLHISTLLVRFRHFFFFLGYLVWGCWLHQQLNLFDILTSHIFLIRSNLSRFWRLCCRLISTPEPEHSIWNYSSTYDFSVSQFKTSIKI